MNAHTFTSPTAFKESLEQRLRNVAADSTDLARRRQLVVFDRFLARVAQVFGDAVILKGGLVLELRLERARTTKDIDLRLMGVPEKALPALQQAGRIDLSDFLSFEVQLDPKHPRLQNVGMPYEGIRYRVEAKLAGKVYSRPFGVDVVFAEPLLGEPDLVTAKDTLGFAGIAPPKLRLYPVEAHIAEKLHAYTTPRERENSRVKDLPDLALLATVRPIDATRLRATLVQTFAFRKVQPVPAAVPDAPGSWTEVYARMAENEQLEWKTLAEVLQTVRNFLDPVLAGTLEATWAPESWQWEQR